GYEIVGRGGDGLDEIIGEMNRKMGEIPGAVVRVSMQNPLAGGGGGGSNWTLTGNFLYPNNYLGTNVGIGTDNPGTAKLAVAGQIKITGGSPAAGKFLTSDAAGLASWATAPYSLSVQALTSSPADGQTVYFGQLPKAPVTAAQTSKVYIPKSGTIKRAVIYVYSGTAGSSESWSLYIRKNDSSNALIETISASTNERVFNNESLNFAVTAGDYIEIMGVQPNWVTTNPLTTIYGGYIWIE
ncbi:MAG: putative membrane-anchored cell surface protein, partial [Parcubacteria group bacterium Gr01-1014_107]